MSCILQKKRRDGTNTSLICTDKEKSIPLLNQQLVYSNNTKIVKTSMSHFDKNIDNNCFGRHRSKYHHSINKKYRQRKEIKITILLEYADDLAVNTRILGGRRK